MAAFTDVTTEYTTKELMAAFVASEIEDGEAVSVGASLPVCRAGILLAHLTHAPNLKVQMSFTMTNLRNVEVLEFVRVHHGLAGSALGGILLRPRYRA